MSWACLAPRVFLLVLQFSSGFQFDQVRGLAWKPAKAAVASSLNVFVMSKELQVICLLQEFILKASTFTEHV